LELCRDDSPCSCYGMCNKNVIDLAKATSAIFQDTIAKATQTMSSIIFSAQPGYVNITASHCEDAKLRAWTWCPLALHALSPLQRVSGMQDSKPEPANGLMACTGCKQVLAPSSFRGKCLAGARRHADLLLGAWQYHVPQRALKEQGLGNPSLAAEKSVFSD